MSLVNLKSSNYNIDLDISKISDNVKDYILEGKTVIDKNFQDTEQVSEGALKIRSEKDLIDKIDQGSSFTIPRGYYPTDNNIIIPSKADYTSSDVSASSADIFQGFNAYINGKLVAGTGSVASQNSVSKPSTSYTNITISWTYPSDKFISGVAICCRTGSYNTTNPYTSQVYMGTGTYCSINNLLQGTTYYITFFPYCIINGSYKWYTKDNNIISTYQVKATTSRKRSSGGGSRNHCGCNDNCNKTNYTTFC